MMSTRPGARWTAIGLLVAALGIVVPIAWERYKSRTELQLQYLSSASLVRQVEGVENLQISYGARVIPSLSRLEFALMNSGRRPIERADIVSPPTIQFEHGSELLDTSLESVDPSNVQAHFVTDTIENRISVSFPLLNPADRIRFSVLISGREPRFSADARIVGVDNLTVVDKRVADAQAVSEDSGLSTAGWLAGIVSAFSLLVALVALYFGGREAELRHLAEMELQFMPEGMTGRAYRDYIKQGFGGTKGTGAMEEALKFLHSFPDDKVLEDESVRELESRVVEVLRNGRTTLQMALFLFLVSGAGIAFVLSQII